MLTQTKEVRDAWRASQRTLDIKVAVNGKTYNATDINSLKYDSGAYTGDTFAIGSTYSNSVQLEFSHLIENLKLGMEVLPSIGIKTSKGYIYEPLGVFIISSEIKMDRNNNLTSISASDRFCGLEGTYKSKLAYPARVLDIIAEICAQSGVKANVDDLSRLPHQADLPSAITGQTYRKALGWIAQLYAGYATFDRHGLFTIRTIAEPNYELDPSQYEQAGLTKNEAPYKISGIQCQTTITTKTRDGEDTDETKTYQVGDTNGPQIKLENNIMTPDRLTNIWEQLKDVTFYPFSLNWFGNPAIEAGDWLKLQDKQGNKFIVPNNSYTLDFNGGLSATSKADQTSSTDSGIAWEGTFSQTIRELQGRKAPDGTVIFPPSVTEPPTNAKPNDVWFKQNGNSTELWVFTEQEDGTGKWIRRDLTPDEIKKQVQEAQSGLNDAKKQIADNLAKADGDIAELNASIRDQKKVFDTDIDELNASIRDQKGTIDGLSTTINTVAIPKITDVTNKVSDALTKINDQKNIVTGLQTQSAQQGKDISKITTDIHGVSVDLANLNGDVNQTKVTVQGLQSTLGNAQGDIAQLKLDAQNLQTMLAGKVDDSVYQNFVTLTNQALAAKLTASDLAGYAKTTELQATASGLQLNIDSVNGRLDNLKIGTRNLLHGTSDQYRALTNDDENGRLQKTTASSSITSVGHYLTGAQFTYAATLMNTNNQPVQLEACLCDNSGNPLPDSFYSSSVSNTGNWPVSVTFSITQKTWFIRTWLVFPNNDGTQGEQVYVKDERLVEGTTPNTWSPNPDDTEQSLTQLSARITANSQRFSSYYTKSETDAKADTAKSDAVNTIKGDANWTGLTNIITNSGFLQSADGFVQKVQQTTLPMLNGGGVNLVKGTSNDWQTLTGSGRFQQTTSNYWYSTSYEKTGDQITYSIRIKNTSSYPVCAEIVGYDSNQSTRVTAAQSPVVQPGAEQSVSVTLTISSSTWWVGGWVVTQDSSTPQLSIQVKSEKLERGSVATPWTPNSAELVTQVAFTELTQTVNGLQSTVSGNYGDLQTRISQTDSAIREELSNQITGVTNQITTTASGLTARIDNIRVGGRNLLHGTSDQYRTLTYKQQYYATTASDMWTSTAEYHNGDQFTYSANISNISNVPVRLVLYCYGANKQGRLQTVVGPTVESGKTAVTSVSITMDSQTWFLCSDIETLDGEASTFSIQVKDEQLEEGNVRTAWTTNPDDIASQFTEVNATINGLQSTVGSNYSALQSQINQTATTIRGEVTNSVSGLQTQITQQDNNFNVSLNSLRKETAWQKVTTAIDANNYTTTGNYWIQAAPNSNTPDGSAWAYLQVVAYPDVQRIKQTWQRDNNVNETYTRLKTGNNWSEWQKTVTAGNIMAQINMSAGTTLIQNNKIYMDASSTVFSGKAFIPNAAITNISADKINTGTLDAGRINVINLNANNITTGTINGANLKIDLNSGEILFQKGRIGSTNGNLNIDIDSGKMSVTNSIKAGVFFENGELYLSDGFALTDNWKPRYGVIRRSMKSFTVGEAGTEIASPTGVAIQTMNYDGAFGATGFLDATKNGASVAIDENGQALINAKQVGLTGGTFFNKDNLVLSRRPSIVVGTDAATSGLNSWGWGNPLNHVGSRIVIDASYVHFPHSYQTTTGSAPNVFIASDGALVRSTSASKYKTDIKRSYSTEYGEKLLNLPTAIWTDKGQKERYEAGKRHIKPEKYFGMIAEDLADAGLDLLVSRNPLTHEIEGIQYERIAPALLPVIKKLKDKVDKLEEKINE